ncbi:hypothetical protein QBC35DRAFT_459828 [Podospora australis]|uniref:Uncharacterized protein n=1 Tax=Podospora australis TaxID=1536484 RepID=A0AAN6X0S9_9PEZI|nr:hypothetical protein QBC35DRAFT_459828 [Podospora australis]
MGGLSFETAAVALVTLLRVSMGEYVESALSQGAWIWVSEPAQMRRGHQRGKDGAKLGDFKMFDDASRGLRGSFRLLWRLKARHLGCVGAVIIVLGHGFETFSQQMVTFEQQPRRFEGDLKNGTVLRDNPAPAPARAEVWDTYLHRGYVGGILPTLSTKAAVYSGIISTEIPLIGVTCLTANCSWPVVPTLGACGECVTLPTFLSCNKTMNTCTYSTASGTNLVNVNDDGERSIFKVAPVNGTVHSISSESRAYFSVFDLLSLTQTKDTEPVVTASECALWFCLQAYQISMSNGGQHQNLVGNYSTTTMSLTNSARRGEYRFVNIPDHQLNTLNTTRYAVTHEAMLALREFMASITSGTVTTTLNTLYSSSDWVEAMWNATTGDLSQWIQTFAASMTGEIRLHGSVSGTSAGRYDGNATQIMPVVKVSWMWLLYPGFMILLSIYFLFHTIIASSRDGICAWKSGVLPMLFCGVDEGLYERGGGYMDVPGGLEERVEGTRVAMFRGEDGRWGFREVEGDLRDAEEERVGEREGEEYGEKDERRVH